MKMRRHSKKRQEKPTVKGLTDRPSHSHCHFRSRLRPVGHRQVNVATMRSPSALLLLGLTAPAQSLHNGLVCTHRSHHRCVP